MKKYIIGAIFCLCSLTVCAQKIDLKQLDKLSLDEAVERTLANNFDILIEKNAFENARQQNTWGNAGLMPQVSANAGVSNNLISSANNSLSNGVNAGLNTSWVLFNGFRVRLTKKQLEQSQQQAVWQLQFQMENTVQQVIQAYYAIQFQYENLLVRETVLNLSKDKLNISQLKEKVGAGSKFALSRDKTVFYSDSTQYINQLLAWKNAFKDLNFLMGEDDIEKQYQLTDNLETTPESFEYDQLYDKMLADNSSLKRQKMALALSEIQVEQRKSVRMPSVVLNTGYSANKNWRSIEQLDGNYLDINDDNISHGISSSIGISIPIYRGGQNNRAIQSSVIQAKQALLNTQRTELFLETELSKSYADYLNDIDKVSLSQKSLTSAEENLSLSRVQLEQGAITTFEFRQVQNSYLSASLGLFNAQFDLILSHTKLMRLTGSVL